MTKPFKVLSRALASTPEGLEGRDPEFIRDTLPHLWLAVQLYFRAEVHGFENVPDEPVLFVGNHSGGANTPDTFVFTLAYHTFMTVEGRPLVALAHEVVVRIPVIGDIARKYGMVQAGQSAAAELLAEGANVLVYPGGDVEVLRPWRDRNKIVFDGRKGFLKLAHERRVKIVPVVAVGGQETFFVLNDGRKMAKLLRVRQVVSGEDGAAQCEHPVGPAARRPSAHTYPGQDPDAGACRRSTSGSYSAKTRTGTRPTDM